MFQSKWIYPPYDEINVPFVEGWSPLTADELAERTPAKALYTSWLSTDHAINPQSQEPGQVLEERKNATELQVSSISNFRIPYTVTMGYAVDAYNGAYRADGTLKNQTGSRVNIHYE